MAFLGKGKKVDLRLVAEELGETVESELRVADLKNLILKSPNYEEEFVKNLLDNVIAERLENQKQAELERLERQSERQKQEDLERRNRETEIEIKRLEAERQFELDKMRLQLGNQHLSGTSMPMTTEEKPEQPRLDLKTLLPNFDPKESDIVLYLNLFERQVKFLKIDSSSWVSYLLSVLPGEIATLIAREPEEKSQNYEYIKQMLLSRYKLSSEKLRILFYMHRKSPESTWKDFHYELTTYFESWLKDLKVQTFEQLKLLMVAEQMKKRTTSEMREHFMDTWSEWVTPEVLAEKLDTYESTRGHKKDFLTDNRKRLPPPKQRDIQKQTFRPKEFSNKRSEKPPVDNKTDTRSPLYCYGCGAKGVIKSKCMSCNPAKSQSEGSINTLSFYSLSSEDQPISIIEVSICNTAIAVCADTGASHSVAGEKLYHLLKEHGLVFEKKNSMIKLADGKLQNVDILTTTVDINVKGKKIITEMIVLTHAKGNRTLLGNKFLKDAGIILDLKHEKWFLSDTPRQKYDFIGNPPDINTLLMVPNEMSPIHLRPDEGNGLNPVQKKELNEVLEKYENCFRTGGEATPFIEHHIDTGHPAQPVEVNSIVIADLPARSPKDIRESQLQDADLKKIIDCFESTKKTEEYANWTERGFLMDQGVLYRYVSDSDSEEAQLVIPASEREAIMKYHHDNATAGHYGEEGTYDRIAKRYYWTGMKKYIAEYVKNCTECNRYKSGNQKPAGLLRTPIYSQRYEVLSIDLFGPLPTTETGKQWIFCVEDCTTRWIELFALERATAQECATTLIEEVFLRYGLPRRIICDNGPQFTSAVLQQVCHTMKIDHNLIPVYWPQSNPVERKNRDLKPRLAILVKDEHDKWHDKLPVIRFAMNTAKCSTTGQTAAFLQFGRELRTVDDVTHDFKAVVNNDNFVAEITPYLKRFAALSEDVREHVQRKQDQRKKYYDKNRRQVYYTPGDKVWVSTHPISKTKDKRTAKFMPKRDGPYLIMTQNSPTTYTISSLDDPTTPLGRYHVSALAPYTTESEAVRPAYPLRRRGRPRTTPATNPVSPTQRSPRKKVLAPRRDDVRARGGV